MDFLDRAPRSRKPRTRGLTTIKEEGYPVPWLRDMLDAYGEYADYVQFMLGINWTTPWRIIEEKVKLYRDYNVNVALDDLTFTVA